MEETTLRFFAANIPVKPFSIFAAMFVVLIASWIFIKFKVSPWTEQLGDTWGCLIGVPVTIGVMLMTFAGMYAAAYLMYLIVYGGPIS